MRGEQRGGWRSRLQAKFVESLENRLLLSGNPILLAQSSQQLGGEIAVDSAGDVFGTAPNTGDSAGSIFEIPAGSNAIKTIASFGSANDKNTLGINPGDILIDSEGNLYGTTQYGGPNGVPASVPFFPTGGTIWELPQGSNSVRVIYAFSSSANDDLSRDGAGNFFGYEYTPSSNPQLYGGLGGQYELTSSGQFSYLQYDEGYPNFSTAWYYVATGALIPDGTGGAYVASAQRYQSDFHYTEYVQDASAVNGLQSPLYTVPDIAGGSPMITGMAADQLDHLYIAEYGDVAQSSPPVNTNAVVEVNMGTPATVSATYAIPANRGESIEGKPIIDPAGDVFVLTGQSSNGTSGAIWELPVGQHAFTLLQSFVDATPAGLVADGQGTIYYTLQSGSGIVVYEWPEVGTRAIQPTSNPSNGLLPSVVRSRFPSSIVAGVPFTGVARVSLTRLQNPPSGGVVTTRLYAASGGQAILLGQISKRYRSAAQSLAETFHLKTALPAGSYTLIAQSVDASGDDVIGPFGTGIAVDKASVNVTASVVALTPRVQPGKSGTIILNLSNSGNVVAQEPLSLTITASGGTSILAKTIQVRIPPTRRGIRLRFRFIIPLTMPAGVYDLSASATEAGVTEQSVSAKTLDVQ